MILDRCMVWSLKETPLHIAAMLGHEKFVDTILDSQKLLPLHLVTAKSYLGIVKKLLRVDADMFTLERLKAKSMF